MVDAGHYQELFRPIFKAQRIIIVGLPLAGTLDAVTRFRKLGSDRCLVVASGQGTGTFPSPDDAEWMILEHRSPDVVTELHAVEALMANPPAEVVEAMDRYDPDRRALVLAPVVTLGPIPTRMAGRRVWGARPAASLALEDKTRIDAFWDRIGVERSPFVLAPLSMAAVRGASDRMNRGAGTVWAGDAREGLHGGAHLIRWVRSESDLSDALRFFSERCDRVRIMPFLEGIPCSIHGLVFPDDIVTIRPVELITLRPRHSAKFLYAGAATYWDPSEADREYMRGVARRVGEAFRAQVGPGTFTVDGVMTEDGFRPTELNPRFGAGLSVLARGLPDLPLVLICQALQGGEALDYRPRELEDMLVQGADAHRSGGGWTTMPKVERESHEHALSHADDGYRLAAPGEPADASLLIGPSNIGGFVRFTPDPTRTPRGLSIAPAVVAAFAFADREFGTNLGSLAAGVPVRR
jgi:hypothetical protein